MKRQKTCTVCPLRSINDLPDSLLTEILSRVATHESVVSCKFVCKLWNSLISCSDFASLFLTNHAAVQAEYQQHIIIVQLSESVPHRIWTNDFQFAADMSTRLPHESSSYTSTFAKHLRVIAGCQKDDSVSILASHNDLLLCSLRRCKIGRQGLREYSCSLFLCNPFTMERLDLPKSVMQRCPKLGEVALMCEPYYLTDAQGRYHLHNSNRRFTVLFVNLSHYERISMAMEFCSETNAWSKAVGLKHRPCETNIVAYKGKFYWLSHERANFTREYVVVYDPSSDVGSAPRYPTLFSCFPEADRSWGRSGQARFGVCHGVLRVMRLFISDRDGDDGLITLCVWELKDNNGTDHEKLWSLERCIVSDQMISQDDSALRINRNTKLLAFDPNNEDIVYMNVHDREVGGVHDREFGGVYSYDYTEFGGVYSYDYTVSCNLRTRNLEAFTNTQPVTGTAMIFPLAQPWWPTPIRS